MPNHSVAGLIVPDSVANHVALELCNTRTGWELDEPREYLVSYDVLAVWAAEVGLLDRAESRALRAESRSHPRAAARAVESAIALRDAWYDVCTSPWEERPFPPEALDELNGHVTAATGASTLRPTEDGAVRFDGGGVRSAGLMLPVHRAALAAYEMLARGEVAHAGRCAGHGCGWTFYDPAHRRHWCIMAICGNRAKARAFAERRRASA
ncbi:MAG TPA: ABATE domain-containing protein [Candidatus Nanopelagicales bacterium]|nr:ABATE domain-containing protein [Candidatus Nanopelagicales bacterium]